VTHVAQIHTVIQHAADKVTQTTPKYKSNKLSYRRETARFSILLWNVVIHTKPHKLDRYFTNANSVFKHFPICSL